MGTHLRGIAFVVFATAAGGCSFLVGTEALTGNDGGAATDAAIDASAEATVDAVDASTAVDAADGIDAGAKFCAAYPNANVCSDFEHGDAVAGWELVHDNGTVTGPGGAPRALDLQVPAATAASSVGLAWSISAVPKTKLRATERIEVVTTPKEVDQYVDTIVVSATNAAGDSYELDVVVTATREVSLGEGSSKGLNVDHPLGLTLAPGWHRVSLTAYTAGTNTHADVQIDDGAPIGVPITPDVTNPTISRAIFGLAYLDGTQSGWVARLGAAAVELDPK